MAAESPFRHEKADDSAGFLLWKLTAAWQARLATVLQRLGITQTQYAILASLRWFEQQREPPTQSHLVEHARIEKMTLSKAIRKLEAQGLLRREASSADSRAVQVRFTARGRRLAQQAVVAIEDADEEFFTVIGADRLARFKALARSLIAGQRVA